MKQKHDRINTAIIAGLAVLAVCGTAIATFFPASTVEPLAAPPASNEPTADLMMSRPCKREEPCNQTWTLTSRLGHILETYEAIIGPRNPSYRILGVEFTTSGRPRTWYPDFGKGARHIIIQLTPNARRTPALALFQLGHEVFHLIEPIKPNGRGSFFEEGLASYFAIAYLKDQKIAISNAFLAEENYRVAYQLVERLAALHKDFYPRVKRFRERNHSFSDVSTEAIRAAFPEAPALVAQQLARPFTGKITANTR